MKKVAIGGCTASWGDVLGPSIEMVNKADVQYMSFDFLAEMTMSLLYRMKLRNPKAGYIPDMVSYFKELLPKARERGIKLISNGGGSNAEEAGEQLLKVGKQLGLKGLKIGIIVGDDLSARIEELRGKGIKFSNLDTGEEDIDRIMDRMAGAYAYIGAERIAEALDQGADIVIGGRLSDNALYVGPWMHEFGWDYTDPYINKIAGGITCGHIIECAGCVTGGGMCSQWEEVPDPWNVGYPICEMFEDGSAIITKTPDTGGLVNSWTVKEHLTYEIHDPGNYLMPDGIADFTTLKLEDIGKDRVRVTNMTGKPRPEKLKVGIGFEDGYKQEIQQWFTWPDAFKKAKHAEFILKEWLKRQPIKPEGIQIDYMGLNMTHGSTVRLPESAPDLAEVGLRVCAKFRTKEDAMFFRRNTMQWTAFSSGYVFNTTTAPANPAKVIALWPTLVPREEIETRLIMKEV